MRFASVDRISNVTAIPGHMARRRRSLLQGGCIRNSFLAFVFSQSGKEILPSFNKPIILLGQGIADVCSLF